MPATGRYAAVALAFTPSRNPSGSSPSPTSIVIVPPSAVVTFKATLVTRVFAGTLITSNTSVAARAVSPAAARSVVIVAKFSVTVTVEEEDEEDDDDNNEFFFYVSRYSSRGVVGVVGVLRER